MPETTRTPDAAATHGATISDSFPSRLRQRRVHRLARSYLRRLSHVADDPKQLERFATGIRTAPQRTLTLILDVVRLPGNLRRMHRRFEEEPLLGAEVLDEALVLWKDDPSCWRLSPLQTFIPATLWDRHETRITELRGGRERDTTTPTLRGGGKRPSPYPWWKLT